MKLYSSQKHSIHNFLTTILLLCAGLIAAAGLTSCENFLDGGDVKREIEDAIAYNNAKQLTVQLYAQEGTGSTLPSGNYVAKQGYDFEISFSENPAYSFVKWTAVSKTDSKTEITDGITFEDKYSSVTNVNITNISDSIRIIPVCEKRIEVSGEPSPRYDPRGVSRDRSITVNFTKELAVENFFFETAEVPADATEIKKDAEGKIWAYVYEGQTYLKNISITNIDDFSIAEHFTCPEIEGKLLTIGVDKTNPIKFNSGEIYKTVKVTLSKNITDTLGIKMNSEKSWNYQITESTDEKANVTLTSVATEGSVYLAGTKEYSLGQKITLSFTEDADYQFVKWDYDDSIIYVAEPDSANTTATILEKTSGEESTQIKAVCAPRLRVTKYSPVTDNSVQTVSKNSSIVISFNHKLPDSQDDLAQLQNISITIGGAPVKSSFKAPSINEDTITFTADNSNMLDVPAGQKKTVSVAIPSDFYYTLEDGTKVTYGGNGKSFDYKIDDTTLDKAEITFTATSGSGELTAASDTQKYSIGQEVPLVFVPASGWTFNGWTVMCDGVPVEETKIKIADVNAPSTKLIVYEALAGVTVRAKTSRCLEISETSPSATTNPKDSSITIKFNQNLSAECASASMLSKIEISSDVKLDSYYTKRTLSGDTITIENTSPISVPKGTTKVITVTVPSDFYYMNEGNKINLTEKSFSFKVDHTTNAKAKVTYQVINGETGSAFTTANAAGTIEGLDSTYQEYNIGEDAELSFALNPGYQFYGWSVKDSDSENGLVRNQVSFKNSTSKDLQPTLTFNDSITLNVNVICYKRPVVSTATVSPYDSNSATEFPKNTPIVITFDHAISSETKDEIIINYSAIANFNKETYFSTTISDDNKTVTLTPIKMLPLEHAYETVKVTVPCDKVYYLDEERNAKITTDDSDFSWSYRINSSTMSKTEVCFFTTQAAEIGRQINFGGALLSSGTEKDLNVEESVKLEFPAINGFQFAGWKIEAATTGYTVEPDDYVTSGIITVKNGTDTYFTLDIDESNPAKAIITSYDAIGNGTDGYGIAVLAKDVELPAITATSPSAAENPKDSEISIMFNKPIDSACASMLGNIKIEMDGINVGSFFEIGSRTLSTDRKTIKIKNTKLLNVSGNETKTVMVTIPANLLYYKDGDLKVYLPEEKTFSYKINSSTAKKINIRFDSSENSLQKLKVDNTDVLDGNDKDYNRGETTKLEYAVPSNYNFAGWKVETATAGYTVEPEEYVTNGTITVSKNQIPYLTLVIDSENPAKAIVESYEAIDENFGISIFAKDIVLPVVENIRINNTNSIYNVTSSSCDSKVYINFSKPIDTNTASLSSSGSINITRMGISSSHYETYFKSSWSSDKKQLVLTPKNIISNLVQNEGDTFGFIITLNANKKEIKDTDGCTLIESAAINNSFDIPYTVNGVRETTKPEFYSTQYLYDKEDSSTRKALSSTNFSSWGSSIFTTNHIKDSVYFYMYGYDKDSGLKALRITETYFKTVAGETASGEPKEKEYLLTQYSTQYTRLTDGTFVYRFTGTHNLQTVNDGVIKLDFQLVDNAGNVSSVKTYYVIKDTVIDESIVKFDETKQDALTNLELRDGGIGLSVYNKVRKRNGDNDTVTLTLSSIPQDTFYGSYKTAYNITVKYGYTKEDITNEASKTTSSNSIIFTFTHNTRQVTFVKIIVSDAAGNTKELLRALPGQAVIASYDTYNDSMLNWDYCRLKFANETQYKTLCSYYGASSFITNSFYKNTTDGDTSWVKDVANCCPYTWSWSDQYNMYMMHSGKGKIFYVYGLVCFKYGDSTTNGDKQSEYWYSSLSDDYVKIIMKTDEDYIFQSDSLVTSASTGLNSSYVVDYLNVTTEPVINSGCYKVVLSDDFKSRVTLDTTNITYSVIAKNYDTNEEIESKDFTFYLPSPGKYEIFLKAEDSNRKSVKSNWEWLKINGTGSNQIHYLNFTEDLSAPALNVGSDENFYSYSPAYWYTYHYSAIVSDNGTAGLVTDSDGKVLLDYYFIPNSNSTLSVLALESFDRYQYLHNTYTLEELEGQYSDLKKTIAVAADATTIQIPFDGLPEGLYTICIVAKDNNGNYSIKCRAAFNKRLHETLVLSKLYSSDYSYFFRANKRFEVKWLESGAWTKKGSYANYEGYDPQVEFNKGSLGNWWIKIDAYFKNGCSVAESGFYDTIYLNLGYYKQLWEEGAAVMDVSSKNIIPGMNGMQVLCTSPTLAHTMYCSRKLSDGTSAEDIATWENMAMETGIVEKSSNFTYGNDKYDAIPSGYYYTTIVHFADGTTLMTDVKQK